MFRVTALGLEAHARSADALERIATALERHAPPEASVDPDLQRLGVIGFGVDAPEGLTVPSLKELLEAAEARGRAGESARREREAMWAYEQALARSDPDPLARDVREFYSDAEVQAMLPDPPAIDPAAPDGIPPARPRAPTAPVPECGTCGNTRLVLLCEAQRGVPGGDRYGPCPDCAVPL